jgi:hypothetical protein
VARSCAAGAAWLKVRLLSAASSRRSTAPRTPSTSSSLCMNPTSRLVGCTLTSTWRGGSCRSCGIGALGVRRCGRREDAPTRLRGRRKSSRDSSMGSRPLPRRQSGAREPRTLSPPKNPSQLLLQAPGNASKDHPCQQPQPASQRQAAAPPHQEHEGPVALGQHGRVDALQRAPQWPALHRAAVDEKHHLGALPAVVSARDVALRGGGRKVGAGPVEYSMALALSVMLCVVCSV